MWFACIGTSIPISLRILSAMEFTSSDFDIDDDVIFSSVKNDLDPLGKAIDYFLDKI